MSSLIHRDGNNVLRDAWLNERRKSVGASDTPILWGESSYSTPLKLWTEKLGRSQPEPETPEQRRGRRLEPLAIEDYQEETGLEVVRTQIFLRHPDRPFLSATLDGLTTDGRIVEVKTVGPYAAKEWGEEGSDEVPKRVVLQVQHQMLVAEKEVADVAVLIGGETFRAYTVHRDERICKAIEAKAHDFWAHVETETAPTPVAGDGKLMAQLFPEPEGLIHLTDSVWVDRLNLRDAYKSAIKADEAQVKVIDALLLDALGSAEFAEVNDGRRIKRSVVSIAERTQVVKAYSYTKLTVQKAKR